MKFLFLDFFVTLMLFSCTNVALDPSNNQLTPPPPSPPPVNQPYQPNFSTFQSGETVANAGFINSSTPTNTSHFTFDGNGVIQTPTSGTANAFFTVYSPDLGVLDRDQNGGIFVQIEMRVPLALTNNATHREKNKFTFGLAALDETNLYSFEYKFHATSDTNNNRFLIKNNSALAQNTSSLLTPTGPSAGWLVFRIEILPRTSAGGSGVVRVLVDEDGDTNVNLTQVLSVVEDTHQVFRRFRLTHRTTDPTQYAMQFRNIQIGPINP